MGRGGGSKDDKLATLGDLDLTEEPLWLRPAEPHRLLWLDNWSLEAAVGIFLLYTLFLLSTCVGLILRRKHYLLQKNLLAIPLLSALMQWTMVIVHLWRYYCLFNLPYVLLIWRNYVFFPLCLVFSLQARGMHILFEVIWTRSIGHPALGGWRARGRGVAPQKKLPLLTRIKVTLKNPRLHVWLKNRGTYLMVGLLSTFHVLSALLIQLLTRTPAFDPRRESCMLCITNFGTVISVVLYMIIWCPIMLFFLADVRDAYGLRRDLKVGLNYAIPLYLLYMSVRGYAFLQPLRSEIPSFVFLLGAMIILHSATVAVPLVRTLRWDPEELPTEGGTTGKSPHDLVLSAAGTAPQIIIPYKPIPLERVLENDGLRGAFEAYCKNAFVWDAILFYRAVNTFRALGEEDVHCLSCEAHRIFEQYIEPGAPCEMNLSFEVVERLKEAMSCQSISPTMFDEAQGDVLRLVGRCTYRNFLYTLEPSLKARYMIPVACAVPKPMGEVVVNVRAAMARQMALGEIYGDDAGGSDDEEDLGESEGDCEQVNGFENEGLIWDDGLTEDADYQSSDGTGRMGQTRKRARDGQAHDDRMLGTDDESYR